MSNLYTITIGVFALAGLIIGIWSWKNISKAKKSEAWPKIDGVITSSDSMNNKENLMPEIEYSYQVDEQTHTGKLELATSDVAMPGHAEKHAEKYPLNSTIEVYYDPENPEVSTLEPGVRKDDWFIFWLCVGSLLTGVIFIFFNI